MRVIETSLDEDLSLFCRYLRQQHVRHRVYEESGLQVLELVDSAHAEAVRKAYEAFRRGQVEIREVPRPAGPVAKAASRPALLSGISRYPGVAVLIVLALVVFPFSLPAAEGRLTAIASALTIVDPQAYGAADVGPALLDLLRDLQVWRWFTPMLLHFSVLHLAFNCVVVIELGRRVERAAGTLGFCVLVLGVGGLSNLGQFAFGGGPLFGGLSGVAYGLLGFILVRQRVRPDVAEYHLPRGLAAGLLLFLVLFSTGITEPFGLHVANAAHWGGLMVGGLGALLARRGIVGA